MMAENTEMLLSDLTEHPSLDGSSTCFSTSDLLGAPLDDSQTELDDFEPTPLPDSAPQSSTNSMFDPTPMRDYAKPQMVKSVASPPSKAHFPPVFPQQQQVFSPLNDFVQHAQSQVEQYQARQISSMMNIPPPQNMIQAQQLQAALHNLRRVNQMGAHPRINSQQPSVGMGPGMQQMTPQLVHSQAVRIQGAPIQMAGAGQPQFTQGGFSLQQPTSSQQQQPQGFPLSPPLTHNSNMKAYSTHMEKLCETMKRSAMSRNMVKHLSARNSAKQGSQRNLVKQHPIRDMGALARQTSGRNANSSSALSPKPSPKDPLRRSLHDSKHRIAREILNCKSTKSPTRDTLVRHNSASALMGSHSLAQLQIDDMDVGFLYDGENTSDGVLSEEFPPTMAL